MDEPNEFENGAVERDWIVVRRRRGGFALVNLFVVAAIEHEGQDPRSAFSRIRFTDGRSIVVRHPLVGLIGKIAPDSMPPNSMFD